jgi:regulator of nonsense transcripts 1
MRKLMAIDRPQLSHLKDCVVFSVKGNRPAADQMSGGDLDGDTCKSLNCLPPAYYNNYIIVFVCWDPDIVPTKLSEPAQYPAGRPPVTFDEIKADDRIEYFARYTSISLSRAKALFLEWAMRNRDGALSRECQELNRLHSLCVDGNRIKIDDRFTKLPPLEEKARDLFILNILHREAEKEAQQKNATRESFERLDPREVVETVLCQPRSCSEFRMIQLVYDWCRQTREAELREFLPYFDLAALTVEQKYWFMQQMPSHVELPALVMNGLVDSEILQPHELQPFHLNYPGMRWKRIFSLENRFANLFEVLERSFSHFHRKLLILRVSERFSIAIYISRLIEVDEEAAVGNRVLVFAFPHTQDQTNSRDRIFRASNEFRLHFNHTTFQLFKLDRQSTFIWIRQPGIDDAPFRQVRGQANRARRCHQTVVEGINHDWIASIALERFSRNIQTQMGRVRRHGLSGAVRHHRFSTKRCLS